MMQKVSCSCSVCVSLASIMIMELPQGGRFISLSLSSFSFSSRVLLLLLQTLDRELVPQGQGWVRPVQETCDLSSYFLSIILSHSGESCSRSPVTMGSRTRKGQRSLPDSSLEAKEKMVQSDQLICF